MSTAERALRTPPTPTPPPLLVDGQRLDQPEFHRRYEAMPPGTRAELIDGVVFMPSPASLEHARSVANVMTWLGTYMWRTPGVEALDGPTVILGLMGEPQPDAVLRILPEHGGRLGTDRGYLRGAPELVVEVARATRYVDLGPKLDQYEAAGVDEYLVHAFGPDEVIWHARREGRLVPSEPGADGLHRSLAFPGLWLDPRALLAGDLASVLEALGRGLASPEHAAFVARLAEARPGGAAEA